MFSMPTATPARKTGADEFLNSENDKNDYDWLLTPPGTPLFPSLEMESQKTVMGQSGTPKARPTALKSRLSNTQPGATGRNNIVSRQPMSSPGLITSSAGLRRPSSSGGPGSRPASSSGRSASSSGRPANPAGRPATPTGRPTLAASSRSMSSSATRPVSSSTTRTSSNTTSRPSSNTPSRPTRSSTPTSRSTVSSTKPTLPVRSSTPTPRSTARSSTPTSRSTSSLPATKPMSRAPTPTRRQPTLTTATRPSTPLVKSPTLTKPVANPTRSAPPPRASSPSVRPRPWKPHEMPGYSLDAPPNLRTSLSDRPTSVTRGRPGAPSSRSSSVEPVTNGRVRRQSCSPSRGRLPVGMSHNSGSSVPVPSLNRAYAKAHDSSSPGSYGTKMVERVINMRKLAPPKQNDKHSPHSNLSAKSSPDSSGFGRSLSKKSLDMAIRHMDIRRTVPGNLRPLMTNIPASSMYSVRPGPTRSRTISVSDSPLATSSNASSEMSVNNNGLCLDGNIDDEINSERCSINIRGRTGTALAGCMSVILGGNVVIERLSVFSNVSDCSSVVIEGILGDSSGRSFAVKIPNRDPFYFWCSERSSLLGNELLTKMKDLLKRNPSLAELTGISDSRLERFVHYLQTYLVRSNTAAEVGQSSQSPFVASKPSRARSCSIQGVLSPRPSSFKLRRRSEMGRVSPADYPEKLLVPYMTTGEISTTNCHEQYNLQESSPETSLFPSVDIQSIRSRPQIPRAIPSSLVSPYYCWCPPSRMIPASTLESYALPPLSSLLAASALSPNLSEIPFLPLSMSASQGIPIFTPLMCDPIVHIPVIDICSSGQAFLVSGGPGMSISIPPLHNPLVQDTESEKSARDTLRLLINGSSQFPSILVNAGGGSRGFYGAVTDVNAIANSFAAMSLVSPSDMWCIDQGDPINMLKEEAETGGACLNEDDGSSEGSGE
uniref:Flocculation protein FLO11-like n=1 Tax=Tanacetum cinerariifolium TaxID=118510 RepID=A0A6L2NIY3_TANCI|nr:hypothetical protein [Tanacetum cinerariifolium]